MSTFTTREGVELFYKDWGTGRPMVFSHGWPLSADAWDPQLMFFGQRGYRVIAHDRRGFGRSTQTWDGNDMDHFADDLADLLEALDLRDVVLVGHSMGGGEVVRYVGRHGTGRLSRLVLISAIPPLMLRTPANPEGTPKEAFDQIRAGLLHDRSQFFRELSLPFYGFNRSGAKVSQGLQDAFWMQGTRAGIKATYDCVEQFSETDFTEDLKKIDVPTLLVHGDDDQIVPIRAAALLAARLIPDATLKVYPGGAHGLTATQPEQLDADLLEFVQQGPAYLAPAEGPPQLH